MGAGGTPFEPAALRDGLRALPGRGRLVVAYSGGLDSTALLHSLAELAPHLGRPVAAVHVNHALDPGADDWQRHCRTQCRDLGIPLAEFRLPTPGEGTGRSEAALRRRRYACFEELLQPGEVLLTAHHRDDQAETVLLNLLRGSGPEGLRGMPAQRPLGPGHLARPLLPWPRAELERWVRDRGLAWLEDPDNADRSRDRNYLRHEVLPALRRRWPQVEAALCRSAAHAAEASTLSAILLEAPLAAALDGPVLALDRLPSRNAVVLRAAIRQWVRNVRAAPIPAARLAEFSRQLQDGEGSTAVLAWEGHSLRADGACLWLDSDPAPPRFDEMPWDGSAPAELGGALGAVAIEPGGEALLPDGTQLKLRSGGERFRAAPGRPSRPLKDLLREAQVPPWLRGAVPLLSCRGEIIAVGDWLLADALRDRLERRGATFRWRPTHAALHIVRRRCRDASRAVESPPALR